ncbi:MAG: hypothetical protein LUD14_04095 [Clostridiales bacterium]|nr:hypothetical protein [Clostridiales bacterium]
MSKSIIYEQFEEVVKQSPSQIAVVEDGQTLTYGQLNDRVCTIAGYSLAGGGITYSQLAHTVHPGDFESDDFLRSYVKAMHS